MSRTHKIVSISDVEGGEHRWEFFQLPADEGLTLALELWELIGGAAGKLIGAASGTGMVDGFLLGNSFAGLAAEVLRKGGPKFLARLLKGNRRDDLQIIAPGDKVPGDGKGYIAFNVVFQGNFGELRRALALSLEHNFASFFDEWLDGWTGKRIESRFLDICKSAMKTLA